MTEGSYTIDYLTEGLLSEIAPFDPSIKAKGLFYILLGLKKNGVKEKESRRVHSFAPLGGIACLSFELGWLPPAFPS